MFFRLSSLELALLIFGVVLGTTLLGVAAGRRLRAHADALREPVGVAAGGACSVSLRSSSRSA